MSIISTGKRLIQRNKKITALFSFNDINALGAIIRESTSPINKT